MLRSRESAGQAVDSGLEYIKEYMDWEIMVTVSMRADLQELDEFLGEGGPYLRGHLAGVPLKNNKQHMHWAWTQILGLLCA